MSPTRREALGAAAVAVAAAAVQSTEPPAVDAAIVRRHDEAADRLLAAQVTDAASPWYGAIPDSTGLYQPAALAGFMNTAVAAYLCPQSRHYRRAGLIDRLELARRHLERRQTADGNLDLLTTNFNSPPDTGFAVWNAAQAASLARRYGARELEALVEPFLKRAAEGLVKGGVHTPNHRWVIASALARIHALYPDPRYVRRIDRWLAEGIDIDSDGHYSERSTVIYNSVCNTAFTLLADKLERPELFDPVRKNLNASVYLLHSDFEIVTEISRRQDQYQRGGLERHWFPLHYLAVHDRNPLFAGLAARLAPANAALPALLEYPELAGPLPAAATPVPDNYEKRLEYAVRIRRGATSATILPRDPRFFTVHRGAAAVEAVRFASAFFGKGQFVGERITGQAGHYILEQELEAGYYQPLDPPRRLAAGDLRRDSRQVTELCRLSQSAEISEAPRGFRLRLRSHGYAGVPLAVEIALGPGGVLEGCRRLDSPAGAWLLEGGTATYTQGGDVIRFGPGAAPHTYVEVRGAHARVPGHTVYLTGLTPFDHTLEFEFA